MSLFPDSPKPNTPYKWRPAFSTVVWGVPGTGRTVRRRERERPLYQVTLTYPKKYWADLEDVYNFFLDQYGQFGTFTFKDFNNWNGSPVGLTWKKVYVGIATAGQTVFDFPGFDVTSATLYVNGASTAATVAGTSGTDGRPQATFGSGLSAGDKVTTTFTGRRAMFARCSEDFIDVDAFVARVVQFGLTLVEDPPED